MLDLSWLPLLDQQYVGYIMLTAAISFLFPNRMPLNVRVTISIMIALVAFVFLYDYYFQFNSGDKVASLRWILTGFGGILIFVNVISAYTDYKRRQLMKKMHIVERRRN